MKKKYVIEINDYQINPFQDISFVVNGVTFRAVPSWKSYNYGTIVNEHVTFCNVKEKEGVEWYERT